MRKYPILLFALVLLLGVSAVFAARAMDAPKDQVAFTERVIYGDPAAADGLTVALHEQYRNYLHWPARCPSRSPATRPIRTIRSNTTVTGTTILA